MLKYDKAKIDHALQLRAIGKWLRLNWIKPEDLRQPLPKSIEVYKDYSLIKRIGLYIVTVIAAQSVMGFFSLFLLTSGGYEIMIKVLLLCNAVGLLLVLEKMTASNSMYRQGIDDALLHMCIAYCFAALIAIFGPSSFQGITITLYGVLLFALTSLATARYADSLMSIVTVLLLTSIPLHLVSLFGAQYLFFSALLVIPLNIVLLRSINRYDVLQNQYWNLCFTVSRFAACLLMYASINLYVIKTLALSLMGAAEIPLQWLFLVLTVIFPVFTIVWGLTKKKKYLLHSGLFLLIPTAATVRHYYSVMPAELALLLAGLALTAIGYFAITYLRKNESGYTFEPDSEEDSSDAETLFLLQQFGNRTAEQPQHEEKVFGGGSFGGGGSGGGF